jgi:UDP-N-acetylmuramyl tripeptide synthase
MSKLRFYVAMMVAKTMYLGLKLLGRNASYLPGKAAVKICKDFLAHLQMPKTVICVTGTNGKTTVSNMLTKILRDHGYDVTNNALGSNVQAGVATALIEDSDLLGRTKKDIAVLEVDERSSLLVYPYIKPTYILCNNIMRDSVKRNAHTDFISFIINKGIPAGTKVVLNADDIICAHLGLENPERIYFGITAEVPEETVVPFLRDIVYCPDCGALLDHEYIRYNHIGRIYCPNCDYKTPDPDFAVTDIDRAGGTFAVTHGGVTERFKLVNDNITNLYNFCAVITMLNLVGVSYEKIRDSFEALEIVKSRHEEVTVGDHKLTVILAKGQNPIACSGVARYTAGCPGDDKTILLSLDDVGDNNNNTENIGWVFDTDYSPLADPSVYKVIFVGKRCHDHYLRALMSGIDPDRLMAAENWRDGVAAIDMERSKNVYLLYELYSEGEMKQISASILGRMKGEQA